MAVSMKDLQSSSDEELQDGDLEMVNNEKWNIESDKSLNSINDDQSTPSEISKQHARGWIKGQVSDSLRRISTRMAPTISPENPACNDDDIDDEDSTPQQQKFTKLQNHPEGKTPADNTEARDVVSKRHWFKGHINNYISKSKRLYYNRNEVGSSNDKKLLPFPSDSSDENEGTNSSSSKITVCNTYSPNAPSTDPTFTTVTPSATTNTQIPQKAKKTESIPPQIQAQIKPIQTNEKSDVESIPVVESDVENDSVPSKLTFSELLNSDSSQKMNTSSVVVNNECVNNECVNNDDDENSNTTTTVTTAADTATTTTTIGASGSSNINNNNNNNCVSNHNDTTTDLISEEEEINNLTDQIVKEDLQYHLRPGDGTSITFFNIWVCTCLTCAYFLYRPPAYIHGVVTGSIVTYLIICIVVWLLCPSAEIYDSYQSSLKSFLKRSRQPEVVKGMPKLDVLTKPKDLRGWIFMATVFEDVFNKDTAKEVFSLVHKERLYIFVCKAIKSHATTKGGKQPRRKKVSKGKHKKVNQLIMEQPVPIFTFETGILIDLSECFLNIKPDDLSIRRIWNRKYPIQLIVPQGKLKRKTIEMTLEELTLNLDDTIEGENSDNFMEKETMVNEKEETLYMFWNTGREKEDWFYRLQLCISPLKHQVTFQDKNSSKQPRDSYPHYMTELIKESEKVMQRTVNGKKMQPYLAWLNIFLGRAFWDFWHESVWAQKLHQKIQTRLSKLNTPPFITDITLTDLNCGHNIPIIHKGSMPALDEHGIWADLQISYKGYFTLTLETQLNIDYYIGLVSSIVKQKAEAKENVQLSKICNQYDDHIDDSLSEKDINDSEMTSLPDVDDFHDEIQDVYSDAFDHPDHGDSYSSGSETSESDPFMADPRTKAFLESRTGKKVVSLVGWLAKSKIAKRVAETDFAKKAYERAYKKFQKMPIVLKVEIQSVKGNLAVNIPPPPTNRLWYGFRGNPVIFITASPKVGDKQVRLTYLTNWIERKLKEEFKKFLVLPNMQDLSIKLMDSHLHDISPDRPES